MAAAKKSTAKKAAKKAPAKKAAKKAPAKKAAKKSTKKATKKATASSGGGDVQLVVASRIKEAARSADIRVAGDFADAFNAEVNEVLQRAINRAKNNNRSTLRPGDL